MQKKSVEMKKVVLTGGHAATTALATIEEILRRRSNWKLYWIGVNGAIEGTKIPTLESTVIPQKGVVYKRIVTGRIQKKFSKSTIPSMLRIPVGFVHAVIILLRIRPHLVLSFGGFASFPVVFVAWILHIPVVVHDQTSVAGRATKFSAPFAKVVAISRPTSAKFFKKSKTVLTGNPVMTQIWDVPVKLAPDKPATIFITGGSRGSQSINNIVMELLSGLLGEYYVIHQTGHMDFAKFKEFKDHLYETLQPRYEVYPVIDPMQMDGVYKRADIVVARGGANTVSEIIATQRPSIIIPHPHVPYDEQNKNARYANKLGIAAVLPQKDATAESLGAMIKSMHKNYKEIVAKMFKKPSPDVDAAKCLVDLLENVLKSS